MIERDAGSFSVSGRLPVGNYNLNLDNGLYSEGVTDAQFFGTDLHLSFTPVPIPAAAWLFAAALVGMVSIKRKFRS